MKARSIFTIVAILCLNLVLTGAAAAGTAEPASLMGRYMIRAGAIAADQPRQPVMS